MAGRSIRIAALRRTFLGSFTPPEVPEELSPLSDEELTQLATAIADAARAAAPEARTAQAVNELQRMADALDRVRGEQTRRTQAAADHLEPEEAQRRAAELAGRIAGDPPPPDPELAALAALSDEDRQALAANSAEEWAAFRYLTAPPPAPAPTNVVTIDGEALGEAMARSLTPLVERLSAVPARRPGLTPFAQLQTPPGDQGGSNALEPIRPQTAIVAGADIPGFGAGQELSMDQVWEAMAARRAMFTNTPDGVQEKHLVARFRQADLPEDRVFQPEQDRENTRKMRAVSDPNENEALVASGGIVPVVEPYYDIQVLATPARPLRGAFATFNASRGGIRLIPPPKLSDASGSIGYITAAVDQAALGGSGAQITAATKPCLHVTVPAPVEYDVAAITKCLEFGNFMTRTYPEQMPAWGALAASQQALTAEQKILDSLSAVHTQVPEVNVTSLSALSQWLSQIAKYGGYLRNHHRMDPATPLHVLAPSWAIRLFQMDTAYRKVDDPAELMLAQAEIESYLSDLNVNVTWYLDSGTGKGQLVNNGAVLAPATVLHLPANVVWHIYPEGSWLRLDSGMLDLGIVRDSSLNSLNNFRVFEETFEIMAFVGLEGLEVTSPLQPSGLTAGTAYGSSTVAAPVAIPTAF